MKLLNKKQIKRLEPYEEHFETIIKAKYKRATSSRVNDIVADVYEEATGEILKRNWSCAHCIYDVFEKCGKLYYKSLEQINQNKNDRD